MLAARGAGTRWMRIGFAEGTLGNNLREGQIMGSTGRLDAGTRLPRPSVVFPACVITVALSAISPTFSVLERVTDEKPRVSSSSTFPGNGRGEMNSEDQTGTTDDCFASDFDPVD